MPVCVKQNGVCVQIGSPPFVSAAYKQEAYVKEFWKFFVLFWVIAVFTFFILYWSQGL